MNEKPHCLHVVKKNEEEIGEMVRDTLGICLGLRHNLRPQQTGILETHLSSSLVECATGLFPFPRPVIIALGCCQNSQASLEAVRV